MASPMAKGILMDDLSFPLYLIEGDDIMIFSSIGDMQMQLEPSLLKFDEMAYDAKGRRLKIEADKKGISVLPLEKDPMYVAKLEAALRKYLIAMKETLAEDKSCDLKCLVQLSLKYTCKVTMKDYIASLLNKLLRKRKK